MGVVRVSVRGRVSGPHLLLHVVHLQVANRSAERGRPVHLVGGVALRLRLGVRLGTGSRLRAMVWAARVGAASSRTMYSPR